MAKVSPLMLAPPIIFALLAGMFLWGMNRGDPNALPSAFLGQQAPQILPAALGEYPTFDASVFADGEIKLVNFWASWCAPCRVEHPNLIEIAQGIPIYGVNQKDASGDAIGFLGELGNPFVAIVRDGTGRQSIDWGVYGLPETFLLDGDGKVLLRFAGAITKRRFDSELGPAIAAAQAQN
ncbi:MAG: DsbE family thiol:disulfide interchange protein [Paracoccaceae bacterium]